MIWPTPSSSSSPGPSYALEQPRGRGLVLIAVSVNLRKVALLKRAFGEPEVSRDGKEALLVCPNCKRVGKTKRKLSVRLEDGVYHCWVCELKGKNLAYLFREFAPAHQEALRDSGFSVGVIGHTEAQGDAEEPVVLSVPPGFILLADSARSPDPDVKDCIRYCRARGLTQGDLWYFKLGTYLSGRYRRRVVMPSFDAEGALNYFTARAIDDCAGMKYLNSKVPRLEVIFNELNIDWAEPLTLVEGPFDLVKTTDNATCLLGSNLPKTSALFRQIVRHGTRVTLALDPDARRKSHAIAKLLSSYGIEVLTVDVPPERDVGDMTKREYEALIATASPWQASDRLLHLISNIRSGSII